MAITAIGKMCKSMRIPTKTKYFKLLALLLSMSLFGACASGSSAPRSSERQATAQAMFQDRCKTAGEKIYKTVEGVQGIYLLKVRPDGVNYADQFKLDDPYGSDITGERYIWNFLHGFYRLPTKPVPGIRPRIGYSYVEAIDPKDGQRYRYVGAVKAVRKKNDTSPNVQLELQQNPNYDLNIYEFVVDKTLAAGPVPRYGVTYDDISTREEREYWIAGSSLRVIDLQTNEVIAERIGYLVDWAQGSQIGGRSPWLLASNQACPGYERSPLWPIPPGRGSTAQISQTIDFVQKSLKSALEK